MHTANPSLITMANNVVHIDIVINTQNDYLIKFNHLNKTSG
ncbi:hypothetical protein yrohd0001_12390 [Yersinia rohdei ATCC 43380]|nr:hypothetical protein yrohd0001_12390 [Yersinia rohdei ATCC 43380]